MKSALRSTLSCLSLICVLGTLSGCTEYWWTRGQPPSVSQLLERSHERLTAEARSGRRSDISASTLEIASALGQAYSTIGAHKSLSDAESAKRFLAHLAAAQGAFLALEPNLSYTSRAPFGELAGQMRVFEQRAAEIAAGQKGEAIEADPFGMFTARTQFFLATELSVPAPNA